MCSVMIVGGPNVVDITRMYQFASFLFSKAPCFDGDIPPTPLVHPAQKRKAINIKNL